MSYTFTGADVLVISAVVVVFTLLLAHWPRGHQRMKTTSYKLGVNAIRLSWEGGPGSGIHEMKIQLNRGDDEFPTIGDVLTFMEEDQRVWRGTVERARLLPDPPRHPGQGRKPKPAAIVVVIGHD